MERDVLLFIDYPLLSYSLISGDLPDRFAWPTSWEDVGHRDLRRRADER